MVFPWSWSTLCKTVICRPVSPHHCLDQWWLIIKMALENASRYILCTNALDVQYVLYIKTLCSKSLSRSPWIKVRKTVSIMIGDCNILYIDLVYGVSPSTLMVHSSSLWIPRAACLYWAWWWRFGYQVRWSWFIDRENCQIPCGMPWVCFTESYFTSLVKWCQLSPRLDNFLWKIKIVHFCKI